MCQTVHRHATASSRHTYLLPPQILHQSYLPAEGIRLSHCQLLQPCVLESLLRRNGVPTGMCWLLLMLVNCGSPDMGL